MPANKVWEIGTSDGGWFRTAEYPDGVGNDRLRCVKLPHGNPGYVVRQVQVVWWRELTPDDPVAQA